MTDSFTARLRDTARNAPVPAAPPDLIERVVAERAAGERLILPADLPAPRPAKRGMLAAALMAASIAALAVLIVPTTSHRVGLTAADSVTSTGEIMGGVAYATQLSVGPLAPPLTGLRGDAIRPGRYVYRVKFTDSLGRVTPDGGGSVDVSGAVVAGVAAWRFAMTAQSAVGFGQVRSIAETVFVTQGELRPISRAVHTRPYRKFAALSIAQRFTADSVLGEMRADGGVHRPIARRLPAKFGPYLFDATAPLGLAGVPLHVGWKAGLSVIGWAVVPTDVFYPAMLEVIGEETIVADGGVRIDCWKLNVVAGRQRRTQWVRKTDGVAIRSVDDGATAHGRRQYDLLTP